MLRIKRRILYHSKICQLNMSLSVNMRLFVTNLFYVLTRTMNTIRKYVNYTPAAIYDDRSEIKSTTMQSRVPISSKYKITQSNLL